MKGLIKKLNFTFPRWQAFYSNLQQDLKFFVFIWLLLFVFRVLFLFIFRENLAAGTPAKDIFLTLYYGGRISLKSAAAFTLVPFALSTLLQLVFPDFLKNKVRLYWGYGAILLLCALFQFRIPYFIEFGNAFDIFLFNTFNDDVKAIVDTAIIQYQAIPRTFAALISAFIIGFIYKKYISLKTFKFTRPANKLTAISVAVLTLAFIVCFAFLTRFGGAFSYKNGIYWKNAARMDQHILNETIYDDIQAMYRARKTHKYLSKSQFENITAAQTRAAIKDLTGKEYTQGSLKPFFAKNAKGAKIPMPKHIFYIIGETYMLWPMLDEYAHLDIAPGMKKIAAKDNALFVKNFLPASNGTMASLTSIILGMPDMNLYPSFRPTAKEVYETSLPAQFKKLGYTTNFFYGGFHSWENVSSFTELQGFDNTLFYGSMNYPKNAWGIEDKYFFDEVEGNFTAQKPTFNLILTSSNHPPLTVKLTEQEVYNTAKDLTPEMKNDETVFTRLSHFEYADTEISDFINDMYEKYPDSIFIFTGDHAQRWHVNPNASVFEKTAVPFIIYGKGINKNMLSAQAAGSHIDIFPTIMELMAPKGFEYFSLGKSVNPDNTALHITNWLYKNTVGNTYDNEVSYIDQKGPKLSEQEVKAAAQRVKNIQAIAYWRVVNGDRLTENK
ncbi:phosphoglycerol transferase MdoB-like AlkP superfamily enzyme [Elusimicrobium posterum]|uniref:LTA synthase family protein n=1 Tax=Elusimicrobium posterum TaxID=3116653 RepID=UPI003C74E694